MSMRRALTGPLSFGLSKAIASPEGVGGLLPAPLLDLQAASDTGTSSSDDITADTTPDFDVTFAGGMAEGDFLRVRDGETELTLYEITAGDVAAGVVSLGLVALSEGEHVISARLERGASVSQYGQITITITASPP